MREQYKDISVSLSTSLPVWPGGHGFRKFQQKSINEGDDVNVTRLDFDVHSGTHIDAPLHFIKDGKATSAISLERMIGKALVLDFPGVITITAALLQAKNIPAGTARVLFKTDNSKFKWFTKPFDVNFIAIDADAAQWLVDNKVKLVGIDGPSIQKYNDTNDTHVVLLKSEVVILEGLDLLDVNEGIYDLVCLPIKALECEGIPVRAILANGETNKPNT